MGLLYLPRFCRSLGFLEAVRKSVNAPRAWRPGCNCRDTPCLPFSGSPDSSLCV